MVKEECHFWTDNCEDDLSCLYEDETTCYEGCERYRKCEFCINRGGSYCMLSESEEKEAERRMLAYEERLL